jgi:hypothetical protein
MKNIAVTPFPTFGCHAGAYVLTSELPLACGVIITAEPATPCSLERAARACCCPAPFGGGVWAAILHSHSVSQSVTENEVFDEVEVLRDGSGNPVSNLKFQGDLGALGDPSPSVHHHSSSLHCEHASTLLAITHATG